MTRDEELTLAKQGAELWDWLAAHPGKNKDDAAKVFPHIEEWYSSCAACEVAMHKRDNARSKTAKCTCDYCPIKYCHPIYTQWESTNHKDKKSASMIAEKHRAWIFRLEAMK